MALRNTAIKCVKGDTITIQILALLNDTSTYRAQMRQSGSASTYYALSIQNDQVIIPAAQSATMAVGTWYMELEETTSSALVSTVQKTILLVLDDITQDPDLDPDWAEEGSYTAGEVQARTLQIRKPDDTLINVATIATNADTATTNANTAANTAATSAINADTATANANEATVAANTAATSANEATVAANTAATSANTAAEAFNNTIVSERGDDSTKVINQQSITENLVKIETLDKDIFKINNNTTTLSDYASFFKSISFEVTDASLIVAGHYRVKGLGYYGGSKNIGLKFMPTDGSTTTNVFASLTDNIFTINDTTRGTVVKIEVDIDNWPDDPDWITGFNEDELCFTMQRLPAAAAQTSADAAQTSADAAQTSADAAQTSADAAQYPKNSIYFDLAGRAIIDGSISLFDGTSDFTITAFMKLMDSGEHSGYLQFGENLLIRFYNYSNSAEKFIIDIYDGANYSIAATPSDNGDWHLVTLTFSVATLTFEAFLDGESLGTATITTPTFVYDDNNSFGYTHTYGYGKGNIGAVAVYNEKLTNEQIAGLYEKDVIRGTSLLHYWDFAETEGSVSHDQIGGLHGNWTGTYTHEFEDTAAHRINVLEKSTEDQANDINTIFANLNVIPIKNANPGSEYIGIASEGQAVPDFPFFKDMYQVINNLTSSLGLSDLTAGDLLKWQATEFIKSQSKGLNITSHLDFDVVIAGAGSAGMGAAYALKDRGYKVCLIEYYDKLGGNAVTGGVDTWIAGNNPSYFQTIHADLLSVGDATGVLANSWVRSQFGISGQGVTLRLYPTPLAARYLSDMQADSNITILTEHEVEDILEIDGRNIKSVIVKDLSDNSRKSISSKWFIDCTSDAAIVRRIQNKRNEDIYYGEDPQSRFSETLAPETEGVEYMNEITHFFRIEDGYDDSALLETVNTVYLSGGEVIHPSYIYPCSGYLSGGAEKNVNAMNGANYLCSEFLKRGIIAGNEESKKRFLEWWKATKLTLQKYYDDNGEEGTIAWWSTTYRTYGFVTDSFASSMGIRESVRVKCETMLTQDHLDDLISSSAMGTNIAYGSHSIDFHVWGNISATAAATFNTDSLKPSGIPYECLIPVTLDNVLVAGKCYGASHIALAARRLNKDMASLGWAAGHAIRYCLENDLTDTRDVDVATIQGTDYTDITNNVITLESKLA